MMDLKGIGGDDRNGSLVQAEMGEPVSAQGGADGCLSSDGATTTDDTDTPAKGGPEIVIGFDTEWMSDPKRKLRNIVLAYGLYVLCGRTGTGVGMVVEPRGPERVHRLSMKRLLGLAIQRAIEVGILECWPEVVTVAVHFGRGDLAACSDFKLLRAKLDAVKGVFATGARSIRMEVERDEKSGLPVDRLPLLPKQQQLAVLDRSGNQHEVRVRFLDTYAVAPMGASLDALGELVGYPKLELPAGYEKEDMGRFKDEQPQMFQAYLLRDAEVTARYALRYTAFCRDVLKLKKPRATLGSTAVAYFLATLKAMKIDRMKAFGQRTVTMTRYSRETGRVYKVRETVLGFARAVIDGAGAEAYSGGRTETFITGPVAAAELRDIDLRSAYPTAMSAIGMPDYEAARLVGNDAIDEFRADVLGFAEVEFEAPGHVHCPPFGVRSERGLIFPRRGVTVATAAEIAAARRAGVKVVIRVGVIIPWDASIRPYEKFVVDLLILREELKDDKGKDTLESKTVKEITNSLYGKVAQAVRPRTEYDARTGHSRALGPSAVTNPVLAAFITGLVRASIAEMLNSIPAGKRVVSVSTDGFLTEAAPDDIDVDGPASQVLVAARRRIAEQTGKVPKSNRDELLEVKKRVREVVAFRNRGVTTTAVVKGSDPVVAKASIKVDRKIDASAYLLDRYLTREYDTTVERRDLISLREQMELDADLVSVLRAPRINLDPDMKRRLVRAREVLIQHGDRAGAAHLSTESEPFDTVDEMLAERALFDAWRHGQQRCLKTMEDWEAWQDYRAAATARRRSGATIRITQGGAADVFKRQFLRALVRGQWGVSLDGWQHGDVAAWLTERGYETSLHEVKNATRRSATLTEGVVAAVPATLDLLRVLVSRFPTLDVDKVFAASEVEQVRRAMAGWVALP